jgi:hypothetical protein
VSSSFDNNTAQFHLFHLSVEEIVPKLVQFTESNSKYSHTTPHHPGRKERAGQGTKYRSGLVSGSLERNCPDSPNFTIPSPRSSLHVLVNNPAITSSSIINAFSLCPRLNHGSNAPNRRLARTLPYHGIWHPPRHRAVSGSHPMFVSQASPKPASFVLLFGPNQPNPPCRASS